MESTAMGIEAETVSPARKPTYTVTAPNKIPNNPPKKMALNVNSGLISSAGTYG
jgi:hypothetical protein